MMENQQAVQAGVTQVQAAAGQTGVNNVPAAGVQTGNQVPVNATQTVPPVPQQGQPATNVPQAIPYERFQEVNDKAKQYEQQNQMLQQQLLMYQANMANPAQNQPAQKPFDPFEGKDGDEPIDVSEARQAFSKTMQPMVAQMQQLQFMVTHPDYNQVVGTPGNFNPEFVKIVNQNPSILMAIQQSLNPQQTAYHYAKFAQQMSANNQQLQVNNQQVIPGQIPMAQMPNGTLNPAAIAAINQASMPGSASMVGSNATIGLGQQVAAMSEADVLAVANRRAVGN